MNVMTNFKGEINGKINHKDKESIASSIQVDNHVSMPPMLMYGLCCNIPYEDSEGI